MAFTRPPVTVADATFSASGAINWNAGYTVAGADVGGVTYCPTATTEATSANFLYSETSGPRLQVGSGTTTKVGMAMGYSGDASGYAALFASGVSSFVNAKATIVVQYDGTDARLNGAAGSSVALTIAGVEKGSFPGAAGQGWKVTAGTATTDVQALSATQTWNAAGVVFTAKSLIVTNIAAAAGSMLETWTVGSTVVLGITPLGAISMLSTGAAPTVGELVLVAGTKTVNTTAATSTCKVFAQRKTAGGTVGFASTYTINAGVSFTLNSDNVLDTSTYEWWIVEAR